MTVNYWHWRSLKTTPNFVSRIFYFFLANELRWVWGIITLAWISIFLAEIAGYGHLLHHNSLGDNSIPLIVKLLVFIAVWQVMIRPLA